MWKPGQLVTIKGKVYRICYIPRDFGVCSKCEVPKTKLLNLCITTSCEKIEWKYMMHSYFKQVYPKT